MRAISKVFVVGTLGLAVLFVSTTVNLALPKNQLAGGECRCICDSTPDGPGGVIGGVVGLANQFASCSVYNNKTCNVADPATGGVRSGKTEGCCQVLDNGSCVDSTRPGPLSAVSFLNLQLTATLSTTAGTTSTPIAPTGTRTK